MTSRAAAVLEPVTRDSDDVEAALAVLDSRVDTITGDRRAARIVGRLEELSLRLRRRLLAPEPVQTSAREPDRNVTVQEAAERLGVSASWIYQHADDLLFVRRIGRKVLCSTDAMAAWDGTLRQNPHHGR